MTHRTDRVWLDPSQPRCEPSTKVAGCPGCARYLATIPPMGIVADFSLTISIVAPWCTSRLIAGPKPVEEQKREVKLWPVA